MFWAKWLETKAERCMDSVVAMCPRGELIQAQCEGVEAQQVIGSHSILARGLGGCSSMAGS